jgi:hypothetical protein
LAAEVNVGKRLQGLALLIGLFVAAIPLSAHHAWPVNASRMITVKGMVKQFSWGNPHVMFTLEVKDAAGKAEMWEVGGPSTGRMENNGWGKTTLKPGDMLTAMGYQFADGQKILKLDKVVLADGRELFLYGRR